MSNYYKTRTVRTYTSDGHGQPKVETKTYNVGGPGGSEIGFTPSADFSDFGNLNMNDIGGQFNVDFGMGQPLKFDVGGGGQRNGGQRGGGQSAPIGGGGGGGNPRTRGDAGRRAEPPKPKPAPKAVPGRATRKEKKNPFAGLTNQKSTSIRNKCLQEGILFEDPEFPCVDNSIFFSRTPPRPFEWKRPHEICDDPQWITDGASRFDVQQGELGDCWLLAAVASLTCNQKIFNWVVEPAQNFTDDYAGIFKFNFWHQGDWKEVVVDDRLPTYRGQLVFMHSVEKNEFWSALLEKAYAKLMGSYESLKGGSTSEAMEDFTGGVTEMFDLPNAPPNLLQIMLKASDRGSLMGCSIDADPNKLEAELQNGLIMGHAYSVTSVKLADIELPNTSGKLPMVRVRNPWGNGSEWKGAWSDGSPQWKALSDEVKEDLGLNFEDDGEFWMSFKDFCDNFQKLEICNLGPDSLDEDDLGSKKKWECHKEHGGWVKYHNAGGCRNYLKTFATNTQFRMTLTDPDDDDDDDLCTALIAVLQKDRRKKRKEGLDLLTLGYVIYKLDDPDVGPLDQDFFKYNASVAKSPTFINMREVCGRHKLPPGTYAIIPSTFEPELEGEFLVRIFSEKATVSGTIDEETGYDEEGLNYCDIPPHLIMDLPPQTPQQPKPQQPKPQQQKPQQPQQPKPEPQRPFLPFMGMGDKPEPTDEEQAQADRLKDNFRRLAGEDMEIDAYELQEILNSVFTKEFCFPGFGTDTCKSMVAMHDGDMSGKLGYEEFRLLWDDLRKWKAVFRKFDVDNSGNLSAYELRTALHDSGFTISNDNMQALVMRYSNKEGNIDFGDFILCTIRLKTMLKSFNAKSGGKKAAIYGINDFIETTMYS